MKVSLFEYLRTGALGKIAPGVSRKLLFEELGAPISAWVPQGNNFWDAVQWAYDNFGISFDTNDMVVAIGMYVPLMHYGDDLSFDEWDGNSLNEDWLLKNLERRSIQYTREPDDQRAPEPHIDHTMIVTTEGDVVIECLDNVVQRMLSPAGQWSRRSWNCHRS